MLDFHKTEQMLGELGSRMLRIQSSTMKIEEKADKSPVTEADYLANQTILNYLSQETPSIPIISEESQEATGAVDQVFWAVDPLDGTKEFIAGKKDFCINIALIESGFPTIGLIYIPAESKLIYAGKGKGAFVAHNKLIKSPIINGEHKVITSRSHLGNEAKLIEALNNKGISTKIIQMGSAIKFTEIAEGNANIYPREKPTMIWDTAAGQAIIEEAGGEVIEWQSRSRLQYSEKQLKNPGFIAISHPELKGPVFKCAFSLSEKTGAHNSQSHQDNPE